MIIAVIAAKPFLGGFESAFQTVQEYTGFVAPGIVAVFLLGMFFKSANSAGAFAALVVSVVVSIIFAQAFPNFSFVNRIWVIFLLCMVLGLVVSAMTGKPSEGQLLKTGDVNFATRTSFNVATIAIAIILIALYAVFW